MSMQPITTRIRAIPEPAYRERSSPTVCSSTATDCRATHSPGVAPILAVLQARSNGSAMLGIDRALEVRVQVDDPGIDERQDLGEDDTSDAPSGIDPVIGIGQAGPGHTAGTTAGRGRFSSDHEAEAPADRHPWIGVVIVGAPG